MGFDWQYFTEKGLFPALRTAEDFYKYNLESQLSRQGHQQRMTQMQTGHEQDIELTDYQNRWREKLEKYRADLDRSLALDKDELVNRRLERAHAFNMERDTANNDVRMNIAAMQAKTGIYRADKMVEAAKIHKSVADFMQYDPEASSEINVNTWGNLNQNYMDMIGDLNEAETEVSSITSNKKFQDLLAGSADYMDSGDSAWLTAQLNRLKDAKETQKQLRLMLMKTENEIIKFASEAKIGNNPVTFSPQEVERFKQIGWPMPVNGRKPRAEAPLEDHLRAIQDLVISGNDLPSPHESIARGFDPEWLEANWNQYRDYFRKRQLSALPELLGIDPAKAPDIVKKFAHEAVRIFD